MLGRATSTAAVGSVALHVILGAAFAQIPVRLGGEFQINSLTVNNQVTESRSVAIESNGDFVVVWNGDDGFYGVFGRRFSSSGAPIGGDFQVNLFTPGYQVNPAVASDGDGDFVVVWASGALGDFVLLARRFDSSGSALATEFQVDFLATNAGQPSVAREAGGDFVVAWSGYGRDGSGWGVFASRFNSSGAAQGTDFQVNDYTGNHQLEPVIDLDQDGDFVIAWYSPHDGFDSGIFAKRFDSAGAARGSEFQINVFTGSTQRYPVIGLDTDGDFIVAWHSNGQDGSGAGVFGRQFASSGAPRGGELQVNGSVTGDQTRPSLGVDGDGDFVVAWRSYGSGAPNDILARHFRASGVPTSGDLTINSTVAGTQHTPAVGADPDGDFVIAWSSFGQDGSDNGVFGQRFDVPALLDIDGNGQITALTDGLLVLRFLFGFTGATLTASAVGPNCTRCDSAAILPYLQSLT